MDTLNVFVVDDERIIRVSVADELRDSNCNVYEFSGPIAALKQLHETSVDVVLTDLKMPEMDGIEFMRKIKEFNKEIIVVMMTSYATVETAIEALKIGAYDFLTKPFQMDIIGLLIRRIQELKSIKEDNKQLRKKVQEKYDFSSFVGENKDVQEIFNLIKLVVNTSSSVLITGETGTGKELLTNVIHYNSNRRKQAFVKVSCAILSREIFESELFGHIKGSFTGAEKDRMGRFEMANEGTLYLDDVDDIPLDLQVKLLRVLEEQEVERVGGATPIKIDVRLIASTKVDLKKLVEEGKFREDLYYRLNVFPIHIKPLRERKSDISVLVHEFVKKFSQERDISIDADAMEILKDYSWPGNVRELRNLVERLTILAHDGCIDVEKIPLEITEKNQNKFIGTIGKQSLVDCVNEFETNAINFALKKSKDNKSKAAEFLKIPLSTLRTKMEKHGIM
jgi:DNA-binding NtrC family response regulator